MLQLKNRTTGENYQRWYVWNSSVTAALPYRSIPFIYVNIPLRHGIYNTMKDYNHSYYSGSSKTCNRSWRYITLSSLSDWTIHTPNIHRPIPNNDHQYWNERSARLPYSLCSNLYIYAFWLFHRSSNSALTLYHYSLPCVPPACITGNSRCIWNCWVRWPPSSCCIFCSWW